MYCTCRKRLLGALLLALTFGSVGVEDCPGWAGKSTIQSSAVRPVVTNKIHDIFAPCSSQQGLFDGYLGQRMEINLEKRLLKLNLDSILRPFEQRPGRQMWVGEHVGKWLHAATLYWEQTGDSRIKAKMDTAVRRLLATQLEDGYLGTYKPEDHWTSWDVWSHKYNLIGLLSYYRATGDNTALAASRRIGDLLLGTFGNGEGQLDIVHSKHSTHVGMAAGSVLEPLVTLYRFTGDGQYLQFCKYIVQAWEQPHGPKLISSLLEKNGDVFRTANNKSYEMMSCLVGCLELYRVTGNTRLMEACELAWKDIREKRLYIVGSSSWAEHFRDDHDLSAEGKYEGKKFCSTSEGCVSVTWMQLSLQLLRLTGEAKYADELERTIYNALLASQSPHTGEVSYFLPLLGDRKRFGEVTHGIEPDVCCCASSVPRGLAIIPKAIVGTIAGAPAVLLYKPGQYEVASGEQTVKLSVETDYPVSGQLRIGVQPSDAATFPLALRVPWWCEKFTASVDGKSLEGTAGKMLVIQRAWKPGDSVEVSMRMEVVSLDGGPSYPQKVAFQRGPQVLAVDEDVLAASRLPDNWSGGQLYRVKHGRDGSQERAYSLVPFADAGQLGGGYDVWLAPDGRGRTPPELDPVGDRHIPIGIPNSLDSLKSFVEAEGGFSPGVGSFGVSFWVYDPTESKLWSPTMDEVQHSHGLAGGRALIPWSNWSAGPVHVRTEVCQVQRSTPSGDNHVVGARATLSNPTDRDVSVSLYVALRPIGPAGFHVKRLSVDDNRDALLVDGHAAIVANRTPSVAGVSPVDSIGAQAKRGNVPDQQKAVSADGACSGAMRFDLAIPPGESETVGLVCPVHAGQRAVRHKWVPWAKNFVDEAVPKSNAPGIDQPNLGLEYYRSVQVEDLFKESQAYWGEFYSGVGIRMPDTRWSLGFDVMLAHAGLCVNEGAADVAVTNYTVFNRDGMYIANMMQKAGRPKLSEEVIDFFLRSPFNGRPFPESDNPGQILWSMGQHWRLTRDKAWLRRVYPAAEKLAKMIEYYRTSDGPYWVSLTSLEVGSALPEDERKRLEPGSCDGFHPEYTEAFDVTGLRVVAELADAIGESPRADYWSTLAERLFRQYDAQFRADLGKGYGSYCVLWPCRLYPLGEDAAYNRFQEVGRQDLSTWRYFAPATAHQGLLAGNRAAGYETVNSHLDHSQMKDWFAFDEGGKSGSGGWHHLRTSWTHSKSEPDQNHAVAMPHGWAIAEMWLLMRDCLLAEDDERLLLLGGVSPQWFTDPEGMHVEDLPTEHGRCSFRYVPTDTGAVLTLSGEAKPAGGFVICLPPELNAKTLCDGKTVAVAENGRCVIPPKARRVELVFAGSG